MFMCIPSECLELTGQLFSHLLGCLCHQDCGRDGNKKDGGLVGGSSGRSDSGLGTTETDMEEAMFDVVEPSVWMCLQCGHQVHY